MTRHEYRAASPRMLRRLFGCACLFGGAFVAACGADAARGASDTTKATRPVAAANGKTDTRAPTTNVALGEQLEHAAGGDDGRRYTVKPPAPASAGSVSGTITSEVQPADTTVVPTHDMVACPRFTHRTFESKAGGVGNSVVWLAGVTAGRADDAPMRATVTLDDCQLEPRVLRVAVGGTVIVRSLDAVMTRLQFSGAGADGAHRGTVALNDDGQVVPTDLVAKTPGIIAIRDDLHPWVRGYLIVSPHPYVAVTDAQGAFRFDGVPAGTYTLVAWHERFGTHTEQVTVKGGGDATVRVSLRGVSR